MQFIQSQVTRLHEFLHNKGLDDRRVIGLVVLGFIGLSVVWSGLGVIQQNYALLQKIALIEEENQVIELENQNKRLQNQYYSTQEFAELKARRVNGKAAPDERVYVVTENAALNHLKTPPVESATISEPQNNTKPKYQQNFEAWIEFFFGS